MQSRGWTGAFSGSDADGMSRPIRYDFPGAVFHITSRGDRREPVFLDEDDRHAFLAVLGQACERHGFSVLAYCLMGNHYHLVACSECGELSLFMRMLNGQYSLQFNRKRDSGDRSPLNTRPRMTAVLTGDSGDRSPLNGTRDSGVQW